MALFDSRFDTLVSGAGLLGNPVLSTSVAGLATSATGFAAVEVCLHQCKGELTIRSCCMLSTELAGLPAFMHRDQMGTMLVCLHAAHSAVAAQARTYHHACHSIRLPGPDLPPTGCTRQSCQ